ncbi:hypothetical protein [Acidipropionibacterium acidipropionici]|nr:hypothetical protein [Acidipropionibacterium acidipropionici]
MRPLILIRATGNPSIMTLSTVASDSAMFSAMPPGAVLCGER